MKRRTFIQTSAVAAVAPVSLAANEKMPSQNVDKELYEIRTYTINLRGNYGLLKSYLSDILKPHMEEIGVNHFMMFSEYGKSEPRKLWVIISYPTADIYLKAQGLISDPQFIQAAEEYNAVSPDKPIYSRFTSQLLLAFDGMPQMAMGTENAGIYELRTYEGFSEDAVRRKIAMFNDEEMALFDKTNIHRVFFADMIAGPHRPTLVYMVNFKDMAERAANWQVFASHPEWKVMSSKEKYANTVSKIRKVFLEPIS